MVGILVGIIAVVIIIAVFKSESRKKYWERYYSRERGLEELGSNSYVLDGLTERILKGESVTFTGCNELSYTNFRIANSNIFSANDVAYVNNSYVSGKYHKDNRGTDYLLRQINVKPDGSTLDIYIATNKDGGYHFVVLPNAILAFISGIEKAVFVAAYNIKAFTENVSYINYQKNYDNITDMAHKDRSYFLRYCDVKDSKVVAAGWDYETKNGYRDGRRQGNNTFRVKFRYTSVEYKICNIHANIASSRTANADELNRAYSAFCSIKPKSDTFSQQTNTSSSCNNKNQSKMDDDILNFVNNTGEAAKKEEKTQPNRQSNREDYIDVEYREIPSEPEKTTNQPLESSVPENLSQEETNDITEQKEKTREIGVSKRKAISQEDARSRNRRIMTAVTNSLNTEYGSDYEFKTYQVRKNRDNWQLQDAGSYAYFERNGTKFCLEFNLRTTLDNGVTILEFRISGDDENQVESLFNSIVFKHNMFVFNNGYSVFMEYDYQFESENEVIDKLIGITKSLTEEVL